MKTTFEPGKNATELGIDTSRKFVVVEGSGIFNKKEITTLREDDNSTCPWFRKEDKNSWHQILWSQLAYADEPEVFKFYISNGDKEVKLKIDSYKDREILTSLLARNGYYVKEEDDYIIIKY